MNRLSALPYFGGKNAKFRDSIGKWIADILPYNRGYAEPFCGMAGVLLQREPSKREILNDLDDRIINWWRVVRDRTEEFEWKIENTPFSQSEFKRQLTLLDSECEMKKALAAHIIMTQGHVKLPINTTKGTFSAKYITKGGNLKVPRYDILALSQRLKNVQLLNMDVCKLMENICGRPDYTIYLDPPYEKVSVNPYRMNYDKDKLSEILKFYGQESTIGISGYGDEWDFLGWNKRFKKMTHTGFGRDSGERVEVLWCNF